MKKQTLKFRIPFMAFIILVMAVGCNSSGGSKDSEKEAINTLAKLEVQDGWRLLFDGKSFDGWRGLGRDHVPYGLWVIDDGMIKKVRTDEARAQPDSQKVEIGDLVTNDTFENFELSFEWKINKGGNSGLKYNVSEEMCEEYGSKYSALGFEYQLIDDADEKYVGVLQPAQFSGSLYDLIPPVNVTLKPIGEFNESRIIVNGNHGEHWLNGAKVVDYEFGSESLLNAYKESKFRRIVGFPDKRKAHIVLQNHNDESWFRNIKIREIL